LSDTVTEIREAIDAGLNTQALDLARAAAADGAATAEIAYLAALASARMGAVDEAEKRLSAIDRDALGDSPLAVEVWGLRGRIAKERFARMGDRSSPQAMEQARTAIDSYRRAFALSGAAYPAVNAATVARLAGDATLAHDLAEAALAASGAARDHWHHASAGEALLLLNRANTMRKLTGWPEAGSATSRRCGGSFC
jgi:imidazolonepropionase-like amidohydrolase